MKALKKLMDKARPAFEPGGKLHAFRSVYDGFDTFLFTPRETSRSGVHIHDSMDSKRTMIIVIVALLPCLLFGMYNCGYQHWLACGATEFPFWEMFLYGLAAILPAIVVSYFVGLGIEFCVAQWRGEEIQEGFLVTGILIPMICPVETPLWMIAVATAFSVIFVKEVFGGTGYNIFNVALVTRSFLFFSYPAKMSGDSVFISHDSILGLGGMAPDGFTGATPLGQIATSGAQNAAEAAASLQGVNGQAIDLWQMFLGLIPGSFAETSTLCILIGAALLLATGIASWRIILSVFAGGAVMSLIAHWCATPTYPASFLSVGEQLCLGGFAFAAVFMAPDPVTSCRTNTGKYIYGFLVGAVAIIIRTYNNG
ncbi:MAG TPA: NADH:ubiquinone reductase (Na(+)-transporting) subunit B, partial [Porphyromonadaceae bacterium]|nr:NADH:ubiquinone reductase (Na(+)-transporting) subunit B [Porphyromonadaceae bacterium]